MTHGQGHRYCRSGNIRKVLFSRGRQIREFKNLAKIIVIVLPNNEIDSSRILDIAKSPKITNARKFKHAKLPDLQ